MSSPAKFISIEGGEGVGKSTNIAFIEAWFNENGIPLLVTREPGGTPMAEEIRALLLSPRDEIVDPTAELLLMFAARAQHLNSVIQPSLDAGTWVLCDRFTDATYAYQGAGRGLAVDTIADLERVTQGGIKPDITLLLDMPVESGMQRAERRGELDRFEREELGFFTRVREEYLRLAASEPARFRVIDASVRLEAVQEQIAAILRDCVTAVRE